MRIILIGLLSLIAVVAFWLLGYGIWKFINHEHITSGAHLRWIITLVVCAVSVTGACFLFRDGPQRNASPKPKEVSYHPAKQRTVKPKVNLIMRKWVNYKLPSEIKPYPRRLSKADQIVVSTRRQRAYIQVPARDGNPKEYHTVYTMYVSTGSHNRTPKGAYHINNVRSPWFYSNNEHEGAEYGTGWHDGGVYLFHATPANRNHQIFKNVADDLGKKPSSHGCVHLTVPDAEWLYNHAVTGMKVFIN